MLHAKRTRPPDRGGHQPHLRLHGPGARRFRIALRPSHPRGATADGPARADSCHFLEQDGCRIHEVKPLQCRTFPFWPEHLTSRGSWHALRRFCPGIGVGPLVQIETVRGEAQLYRESFPDW
ncbi:MAG: YkgJ family cysteine cluster protein [Acidobacteria bacterium]|nr:YkgJ family cysteine cluster protein [Acidobacteriota bacterium]